LGDVARVGLGPLEVSTSSSSNEVRTWSDIETILHFGFGFGVEPITAATRIPLYLGGLAQEWQQLEMAAPG
jgi:hypothetical protein